MRPLKATATTSKPVLTMEQIETIFYKIQDIYEIHKEFYDALYPNIQQWDDKVTVGHLFQKLVSLIYFLFIYPLIYIYFLLIYQEYVVILYVDRCNVSATSHYSCFYCSWRDLTKILLLGVNLVYFLICQFLAVEALVCATELA